MQRFIENTRRVKKVIIPPSKSYAQRAILAAALCPSKTEILNIGESQDVKNILQVAQNFGAEIKISAQGALIQGGQTTPKSVYNVGESGLGFRLTVSLAAVLCNRSTISGTGSLKVRSMSAFETILPQLGLSVTLSNNKLPIDIVGHAEPNNMEIDGSISSQYLSGLLMALPLLSGDSTISVKQLTSRPYIDITIDVLKRFNIEINQNPQEFFSINGNQKYSLKKPYVIEGDYSGASMWMVHGAITNGIQIKGLNPETVQGDKVMLNALTTANVAYDWTDGILIIKPAQVKPIEFDATHCPDLFPALVVLAAAANGTSRLTGANRLIHKESNRAMVLQNEFKKLGLTIKIEDDVMIIYGTGKLKSGTINSNNDHRISMSGAIAASLTDDGIIIDGAECVKKSYPSFWKDFT